MAFLVLLGGLVGAAPAAANSNPEHPEYTLSIVEGESTLPEEGLAHTSASVHPRAPLAISIVRNGIEIGRASGTEYAGTSAIPQPGDVVTLLSPPPTVVGSFVYDGMPSIDPTVCAGSTNFSGQRSAGQTVEGGYYTLVVTQPYGRIQRTASGAAQVTGLSGSLYSGGFLAPLQLGETVWANESLSTTLAGGATFTYSSENDRPVGACPAPPPPPPPPPLPPALQGAVSAHARTTIHGLLTSGWLDHVTINQPGTVTQDLYLEDGTLPAYAAKKGSRRPRKKPPAILIARGSVTASGAGTVEVRLRVTSQGRRKLKHARSVKAVLVTTLQSHTGAKLALPRRTLSLRR